MAITGPQEPGDALERVLDQLGRAEPAAVERLFGFLAIPSVSTDPSFHQSCVEAAEWCAGALREIGFEARRGMDRLGTGKTDEDSSRDGPAPRRTWKRLARLSPRSLHDSRRVERHGRSGAPLPGASCPLPAPFRLLGARPGLFPSR